MTRISTHSWPEANQRYLMAALAVVRARLQQHAGGTAEGVSEPGSDGLQSALAKAAVAMPTPSALDTLCTLFGLSEFERDLLLLCAGVELDGSFATLCAAAQGDNSRPYPTFGLALAALADPEWNALTPSAALRFWRMIEVGAGSSLTSSPLRIDERLLHYLAGINLLDDRLVGIVEPVTERSEIVGSHALVVDRIVDGWSRAAREDVWPVVQINGDDAGSRRMIAAATADALGQHLESIAAFTIPTTVSDLDALIRLRDRESLLTGSALLLDCDDLDASDSTRLAFLTHIAERARGLVIVVGRERLRSLRRATIVFDVRRPLPAEQHQLWTDALGPAALQLNGEIDRLVSQFNLSAASIRLASVQASSPAAVWDACRAQARPRLDDLAHNIEALATWDDLVLPEAQSTTLREIAAHVRQRATVYETWGFGARSARGLGISALFAGASGTGKTMAAEVLAAELRLDLYRIDLSQMVSKYIGETEKNLRRVFDAAEQGGVILLFDEADALFGKRSEVKDSHDRYANIEVSYLLQRMESYRGLAILTTNMKQALDTAFLRRIRFVVEFPFPDAAIRDQIWRRAFPAKTPTSGIDIERLARLNVAGGNIRNVALGAAFLAADAREPVGMKHLLRAAQSEYAKLERALTASETAGWVS